MAVIDPTIDQGDPGDELMQNPPQAGPPQTRSVVGPDGSLYVAGPYSQYNADPTKIPAVNPLPPIYPPGYQAWQPPPPPDPEEIAIQQQQKMLAEGPLNAQTIQQSMQAAKAAQRFMAQRGLQRDLESGKDQAEAYRRWLPQILRDDPKALASFGAQVIKPKPVTPQPVWVPADEKTGAPAHFVSPTGAPHFVPQVKSPAIEKLSEPQKALLAADVGELKAIEEKREAMTVHGFGVFHPLGGNKEEADDLEKRAAELRKKISLYEPSKGKLTKEQAAEFKKQAGGNRQKAEQLARDAGFEF